MRSAERRKMQKGVKLYLVHPNVSSQKVMAQLAAVAAKVGSPV